MTVFQRVLPGHRNVWPEDLTVISNFGLVVLLKKCNGRIANCQAKIDLSSFDIDCPDERRRSLKASIRQAYLDRDSILQEMLARHKAKFCLGDDITLPRLGVKSVIASEIAIARDNASVILATEKLKAKEADAARKHELDLLRAGSEAEVMKTVIKEMLGLTIYYQVKEVVAKRLNEQLGVQDEDSIEN